jgi:hypothetical protein
MGRRRRGLHPHGRGRASPLQPDGDGPVRVVGDDACRFVSAKRWPERWAETGSGVEVVPNRGTWRGSPAGRKKSEWKRCCTESLPCRTRCIGSVRAPAASTFGNRSPARAERVIPCSCRGPRQCSGEGLQQIKCRRASSRPDGGVGQIRFVREMRTSPSYLRRRRHLRTVGYSGCPATASVAGDATMFDPACVEARINGRTALQCKSSTGRNSPRRGVLRRIDEDEGGRFG